MIFYHMFVCMFSTQGVWNWVSVLELGICSVLYCITGAPGGTGAKGLPGVRGVPGGIHIGVSTGNVTLVYTIHILYYIYIFINIDV